MTILRLFPLCLATALVLVLWPAAARAQGPEDMLRVELLPGWRAEGGAHYAGVRLRLAPGWKTYWRAPGDGGIPPRIEWRETENLASARLHWPVPEVFWQNGMRSVGYAGVVTFPVEVVPSDAAAAVRLAGRMEIGVCEDICVPVSFPVALELAPAGVGPGSEAIRAALADRPLGAAEAGVEAMRCRVAPIRDGLRVALEIQMPPLGPGEETVVELAGDGGVWVADPVTRREGGVLWAETEMVPPEAAPFALAREAVRVTVLAAGRAVDIRGCTGG